LRFENIEKRIKIKEARTKNQDFFEKRNTLRTLRKIFASLAVTAKEEGMDAGD
jgi:hypothetical protein